MQHMNSTVVFSSPQSVTLLIACFNPAFQVMAYSTLDCSITARLRKLHLAEMDGRELGHIQTVPA